MKNEISHFPTKKMEASKLQFWAKKRLCIKRLGWWNYNEYLYADLRSTFRSSYCLKLATTGRQVLGSNFHSFDSQLFFPRIVMLLFIPRPLLSKCGWFSWIRIGKCTEKCSNHQISNLQLVSFLQLICVFVFAVVTLLWLDGGIDPLLLHFRSGQVNIIVCFLVCLRRPLRCPECLLVFFLGLCQLWQRVLEQGLDSCTLQEMLKTKMKCELFELWLTVCWQKLLIFSSDILENHEKCLL